MSTMSTRASVLRYRELLGHLAARNLKVKYKRSALGFVWTLLNPVLTIAVLVAVFTYIVKIRVEAYWAFLVSGYFVWNFVIQMLNTSTWILAEHAPLRRSVRFPMVIPILAAAVSRLVEFAVELLLVLAALIVLHHQGVPASWVLLPLLLVLLLLVTLGLVLPLASLAAYYYDVQHVLPIVLMTLFYASPVFYPVGLVPEAVRAFYYLNPIAGLLTLFHTVLYDGAWPPLALLAGMTVGAVALAAIGYATFARHESVFVEIL